MAVPTKKYLVMGSLIFVAVVFVVIVGILILLPRGDTPPGESSVSIDNTSTDSGLVSPLVFFSKVGVNDCQQVFGVRREVSTEDLELRVLEELLKGPRFPEIEEGYRSNLANGIKIQSFNIMDGVAYIDFNQAFNLVAGSCRIQAIRSQIEETLKQFKSIESVVISVEGNTEGVLQP